MLVNNSGTTWGAPAAELPLEAWQKVIDVNLTGLFSFTQAAGRVMIEQRRGSIVNNASIAAFVGESPDAMDAVAYSASKGAVVVASRATSRSSGPATGSASTRSRPAGSRRRCPSTRSATPASLLRDRIPMGRFGAAEELKGAVALLASAAGSFMTGSVVVVDGGQTAW